MSTENEGREVSKKTRNTIHTNPALVIIGETKHFFDNKEDAERHIKDNLQIGESCQVYLLYKKYTLEETRAVKLKAS